MPGTGNECEMDPECGDGRTCNTAVTDCGATRCRNRCDPIACTGHSDCGSWVCINNMCAEPPACDGQPCPGDLVCNMQMVCQAPTPCTEDTDCLSGDICAGGSCGAPQACTTTADCPVTLACQLGTCDDPCSTDAQCGDPAMFTCEMGSGLCRQRCLDDNTCDPNFICESFTCLPAQCTQDADCTGAMMECQGEEMGRGRCVEVFACMNDSDCPPNFTCPNGSCLELPTCVGDRDCANGAYCQDRHCQPTVACMNNACDPGFDCIDDRCLPAICRGDSSCPSGEVCVSGTCGPPAMPNTVAEVRILNAESTLPYGGTFGFTAVALDTQGGLVPGIAFDWGSSDTNVATIDADGLATALNQAGQTNITASVMNGAMTVTSAPVALRVIAPSQAGLRITVVDRTSGAPVPGAEVLCGQGQETTDAAGQASFTQTTSVTCTVFSANHDYLTVAGISGSDLVLSLGRPSLTNASTGYTGSVDTSGVTNPVQLSFSGGSFGGPLAGFLPANILGGDLFTFDVPVIGGVQLPSGGTVSAVLMGFPIDLKTTYYARTAPGLRRAWTFVGGAEVSDLDLTGGQLLQNIIPLLQTFRHGGTNQLDTLVDLPYVVDSADIDGDGDSTEMVPDYNAFVPRQLAATQTQNLRFVVDGMGAQIPTGTNSVLVVSGVQLPSVGFVPLGLDGFSNPAGGVDRFTTAMTPPYDGLEAGEFAVLVTAVTIEAGALPLVASARVFTGAQLPTEVQLTNGWMDFPAASFMDMNRTLSVPAVAGADAWRAQFRGPTGGWEVIAVSAVADFTLPTAPMGFDDRSAGAALDLSVIDLAPMSTLDEAFAPGADALELDRLTSGFSQQRIR